MVAVLNCCKEQENEVGRSDALIKECYRNDGYCDRYPTGMGGEDLIIVSREDGVILHVNLKPALPRTRDKVKGKQEK